MLEGKEKGEYALLYTSHVYISTCPFVEGFSLLMRQLIMAEYQPEQTLVYEECQALNRQVQNSKKKIDNPI